MTVAYARHAQLPVQSRESVKDHGNPSVNRSRPGASEACQGQFGRKGQSTPLVFTGR
ncbi:unnamed protein product [Ciceribacter selenitireducens ATCC BAA-1503]|uniref:Uncharacterized protein n=1 Tax=Ciceribacter selenitireducens ATCC BAA-1503 TaxID=1336235 RepID=A0A376ALL1_9HYPH|nr:unnamed protein product [Ciceribacter selenitireducens ATCC BAA-1503]